MFSPALKHYTTELELKYILLLDWNAFLYHVPLGHCGGLARPGVVSPSSIRAPRAALVAGAGEAREQLCRGEAAGLPLSVLTYQKKSVNKGVGGVCACVVFA